jgi:molybdopterin molybdotransferase
VLGFHEALTRVLDRVRLVTTETVPLADGLGRVLAEEVATDSDIPPFDTTAMDGWALRAADLSASGAALKFVGRIGAGSSAGPLLAGETWKVMTGAPMPDGSDAVIPVEDAVERDGTVTFGETPRAGAHVRRRGEVAPRGAVVLKDGRRLSPADLAVAAAGGRASLLVRRVPRMVVLPTGDELLPPGAPLRPGAIRNTNGPLLHAALRRLGGDVTLLEPVPDTREALREAIGGALALEPDILVTSGGVSAGDFDLVPAVLEELGAETVFHKLAVKPAKPVLFAVRGATLIFALPGNPVSAAIACDFLVRPAVRTLLGLSPALPDPLLARLLSPVKNRSGRLLIQPARLRVKDGQLFAEPLDSKGSHDLVTHARAEGFLFVPPHAQLERGAEVNAQPAGREATSG